MARLTCILMIALAAIGVYADAPEKLVSGVNTSIQKYPFAFSLRLNGNHICGGAIINKRYVMTAAHCLVEFKGKPIMKEITVVTGTTTLNKGGQVHEVEDMYVPEEYIPKANTRSAGYDIGLIKLTKDIVFSNVQQPVPLSNCQTPIASGETVTIVAWGTTFLKGPVSNVLQKLDAKYIMPDQCQQYHLERIASNEFCTIAGLGKGTCQGDSGSSVIYKGKIVGVVSGGRPCARGIPDIKTNVCSHIDWIQSTAKN